MQKPHTSSNGVTATEISSRVVAAIAAYKGSLKKFSAASGIPYPSLREYASGEKKPGLDALATIVKVSGVSPLWLFTGEGEMYQHREATKTLHVDGRLLRRVAAELELAWIRVRELKRDAVTAVLEALPLGERQYYRLVADEMSKPAEEVDKRIEHVRYMTTLAATIYSLVADIEDEQKRDRRTREEAYGLIVLTESVHRHKAARSNTKNGEGSVVESNRPISKKRHKSSSRTKGSRKS